MNTLFERIVIDVPALTALDDYRILLGVEPSPEGLFMLGNTSLLLRPNDALDTARISGVVLARPAAELTFEGAIENELGLALEQVLEGGEHTSPRPADLPFQPRVDHLVVRATDPEACIALFRNELGMRLALDQLVPEWGGRMLFFRSGKLTLEVIAPLEEPPEETSFWGITFQCENTDATAARLRAAGVTLSEVRKGRKPGTRVATVKSHCLGLPTLLLEPAA